MCKIIKYDTVVRSQPCLTLTPWTETCHISLSFTISWSLLKLMSTESVMLSNYLILSRPLLLLPSIFPSIRLCSTESTFYIRWPKYWNSASASVLPMNTQGWFPLGLIGLISLQSKGLSESTTLKLLLCTSMYIYQESYIVFHSFSNSDSSSPPYFLIWDAI